MGDCSYNSRAAAGRIITWLNTINRGMGLKSINLFLENARTEYNINYTYQRYTTDALNLLLLKGTGIQTSDAILWNDIRNQQLGINIKKVDNRSASEIINDTFIKHGLKIKKEVVN